MIRKIILIVAAVLLCMQTAAAQQSRSLFSDIKAAQVGDVLSVIIAESANASRESKSRSSSNSGFEAGASSSGNLSDFLPVFGGSSSMSSNHSGTDGTEQKDQLTGRITVRIIEETQGGMFKIKGERQLGVNGSENVMKLQGYIRPRDISTDNTIFSYEIADAQITYRKSGITNRFLKPGTISKVLTYAVGGLMVAAGAGYFVFQ